MSATVQCPGSIAITTDGLPHCVDGAGASLQWIEVPDFDPSQIDTEVASGAFGAGFIIVGTCWVIGKGASMVIQAIKGA